MAKRPKKPAPAPTPEPTGWPDKLRALRADLGLTQAEAADLIAVGQGVWAAWESGIRTPSRQSALLIKLLKDRKIRKKPRS